MANYRPKGEEYMRRLARKGGVASGETRRINKAHRMIVRGCCGYDPYAEPPFNSYPPDVVDVWAVIGPTFTLDEAAAAMRYRENRKGGSHDRDWRCPKCRRFNSTKSRLCGGCSSFSPRNGRLTRARLREKAEEHRIAAILRAVK